MRITAPPLSPGLSPAQQARCLEEVRADFAAAEVLYRHENRIVIRWREVAGASLILKMWSRPDWRGGLRRTLRIGSCEHEWRSLRRLERAGVAVPRALGLARIAPAIGGFTDALFMEDLGQPETANAYLRRLLAAGDAAGALAFENAVIGMTARILDAGIIDVDHGWVNIMVRGAGEPVRLDVELARYVGWPRAFPELYGRMLGHLVALHAFAVQPDMARNTAFAQRVVERLDPPRRALAHASAYVRLGMRMQLDKTGIDTCPRLPWER